MIAFLEIHGNIPASMRLILMESSTEFVQIRFVIFIRSKLTL